jgi:DNA invertase Pin-like site-specific DNA recombinase
MNNKSAQVTRAVAYLRVASAQRQDRRSVELQRRQCEQVGKRLGVQIVAEYCDVGASGNTLDRVGYQRMMVRLHRDGDIAYVITADAQRLARNLHLLMAIDEELHQLGVSVKTAHDDAEEVRRA